MIEIKKQFRNREWEQKKKSEEEEEEEEEEDGWRRRSRSRRKKKERNSINKIKQKNKKTPDLFIISTSQKDLCHCSIDNINYSYLPL